MYKLHIDKVTFAYGPSPQAPVLADIDLSIGNDEFVAVVGRSGSGKTSLLSLAAGFLKPTTGHVHIDGRTVEGPSAERAVVFQDDALFPWLTARQNVGFALKLKGVSRNERDRRVAELLSHVDLAASADKAIWELSGGMRQRVGIARALAADPEFLLMDEPLGALDALTRERMQEFLLHLWQDSGAGVLLITHGIEEALFLATRVVVLAPDPGRIVADIPVDFGRRLLRGDTARTIKSDPAFVAAREKLRDLIELQDFEV